MENDEIKVTESDLDAIETALAKKRKTRDTVYRHGSSPINRNINMVREREVALHDQLVRNLEQVQQLEYEAWRLRTMGKPVHQIAEILQTTVPQVKAWLASALASIRKFTQELIDLDRELELSRTELLLEHYLPLALMDNIVIERIRQGEPIAVEDFEKPERAAWTVIELIKLRCKIHGITVPQVEQSLTPAIDIVSWLRTQKEFITRTVEAAPRDVLSLEVDNPIDERPSENSENKRSPEEFPGAL